jgi:chromosome segregation protein
MNQNLLRVKDIISEIEGKIGPLKEQSEIAKKYLDLKERLKILEINLFFDNVSKYSEKLVETQKQMEDVSHQIQENQQGFTKIQEDKKDKQSAFEAVEKEIEQFQQKIFEIGNKIEVFHSEIKVAKERIENDQGNVERIFQEIEEYKNRISELDSEKSKKTERLTQLAVEYEKYQAELTNIEQKYNEVSLLIDSGQEEVENNKTNIIEKMNFSSEMKMELNTLKGIFSGIEQREEQIEQESANIIVDKDVEKIKEEEITENIKNIKREIAEELQNIEKIEAEKVSQQEKINLFTQEIEQLKNQIGASESRIQLLKDLEKEHEGYSRSVKGILEETEKNSNFKCGIFGALAQLIEVPKEFELSIEMALGPALQNIVTDTQESAQKAIEFLKQRKLGRATFLPMNAIKEKNNDQIKQNVSNCAGFIGIASKLISFDMKFEAVFEQLLGRTVVVDNLSNGIQMAKSFNNSFRIVTLDGDVLNTSGAMSGGSIINRNSPILSRSREMKELTDLIQEKNKQLDSKVAQIEIEKNSIVEITNQVEQLNLQMRDKQLAIAREEERLTGIQNSILKLAEKYQLLQNEKEQLAVQKAESLHTMNEKEELIKKTQEEIEQLEALVQAMQEKFKNAYMQKDKINEELTNIKISLSSISESKSSIEEMLERIDKELEACNQSINKRNMQNEKIAKDKISIDLLIETTQKNIEDLLKDKEEDETKLKEIKNKRENTTKELNDYEEKMMDKIKVIDLLKEESTRLELKKSKLEIEVDGLKNRLWDEYELTPSQCDPYRTDLGNIQNAIKETNQIKSQIKALGTVNVLAIDEYITTKERYDFLTTQKNDLETSEAKLKRLIYEMTSVMKQQFLEQFHLISKSFDEVFKELFGGGRAAIKLVDEQNILESGIEIEVQPPGKKLQNLMLLSGGEKAFSAMALLFGILKINPSPFCILDEIEAALDEVNVFRFADYIKKLSNQTQFIVVTHRRGTMESADTIYGVTMEERGISKLLSIKLDKNASQVL